MLLFTFKTSQCQVIRHVMPALGLDRSSIDKKNARDANSLFVLFACLDQRDLNINKACRCKAHSGGKLNLEVVPHTG